MKFRSERDGLLDALVTAGRAGAARMGMGFATQSLRLAVRGSELEVTGSDPDLVIEVVQVVSGEQDGTVLIPSRLATEIIRSFDPGTVSVEGNDQEARITSGRAEFVIRVPVGAEITPTCSCGVERHRVTGWTVRRGITTGCTCCAQRRQSGSATDWCTDGRRRQGVTACRDRFVPTCLS